jgi:hypothetical protein
LQACLKLARQQAGQAVNLQKDCPALFKELEKQSLLSSFDPPLIANASVSQLEFLDDSSQQMRPVGVIHQEGLERLLADILIVETDDPKSSWWQSFLKWLDSIKPAEHENQYQWLQHLLEALKPSEHAAQIFIYASIALLLALSAWLVASELYQAGVFRKFTGRRKPSTSAESYPQTQSSAFYPLFDALTYQQQIAALLSQLINALAQRQLIPADPSLTHRQLVSYYQKQTGQREPTFPRLVNESEPLLYGHRAIDAELVGYYRREVQALIGQSLS